MIIEFIKNLLNGNSKEFYTNKERKNLLEGFKLLKNSSRLNEVQKLKTELLNTPINSFSYDEIFRKPEEICMHQMLNYRRLNFDFVKNILINKYVEDYKIKYGLPKKWRKILKEKGYKLSFMSSLNWEFYKIFSLFVGLFYGLNKIIMFFFNNNNNNELINVVGVGKNQNLKQNHPIFFDWILNQKEFKKYLKGNFFDDILSSNFTPRIQKLYDLIHFIFWLFKIFLKGLLFFDQKNILFIERIDKKIISMSKKGTIPKFFFFSNQYATIRPLWTYEYQNKDFDLVLFFYSVNNYSLKFNGVEYKQQFNWELSNWPIYWVWDDTQQTFLIENCKHSFKSIIKGPIPFTDKVNSNISAPIEQNSIIIFDVQPKDNFSYALIGMQDHYYSYENSKLFFEHILEISKTFKKKLYFKRKRESVDIDKKYVSLINNLKSRNELYELESDLSVPHLLMLINPCLTIHMPFTSTAIIANNLKIPTVYYDPINILDLNHPYKGKIELFQNKVTLKKWVKKNIIN